MALWTAAKLQRVREVIARHHAAVALAVFGVEALPPDLLKDLRGAGVDVPDGPHLIGDAFAYGQLLALLRDPALATRSPTEIASLVEKRQLELQLTPQERAAVDVAKKHAGQYVVGLGTRVAGQVMAAVTGAEANLTPERMVEIIREKTAGNLARRETIDSLRSDLGHAMGNWTRDWQRIAMTESNNAIQEGTASTIEKQHGADELVSKVPRPDACPDCKRLYLRGGEPIIFKLSELRANGSNVGRKKRDWKPTVEAVHPWCGCVLVRIPAGMEWEDGELRPAKVEKSQGGSEMPARRAFQTPLRKAARKLHGRLTFAGMPISIENRRGSLRHWYDPVAKEHGTTKVLFPYGYIRLTEGSDGDHVDCYIGPDKQATHVYVIHQRKKNKDGSFGGFDEDKAMLGWTSASAAKAAYLAHYNDPRFFGSMTTLTIPQFKGRLIEHRGRKIVKAWREPTPLVLDGKLEKGGIDPCPRCGAVSRLSDSDGAEPCWTCRKALEASGTPYRREGWDYGPLDSFIKDPMRSGGTLTKADGAGEALELLGSSPARIGMMSWRGNEDSPRPERPANVVGITDEMGLTVKGKKKRKKERDEAKAVARASRMSPEDRFKPAKKMEGKYLKVIAPDTLKEAREEAREGATEKRERIRDDLAHRQANKPPMDPVRIARARGES